jgi:hypothetical protein
MQNLSAGHQSSFFSAIANWWRQWMGNRAGRAELENYDRRELQRLAQEIGADPQQLRALAGKWPESADLLARRMAALQLDAAEIARSQAGVSNDLNKLCSLCVSKGRCERDLAGDPNNPVWREYCPNMTTLTALEHDPEKWKPVSRLREARFGGRRKVGKACPRA